MTIKFQRRQVLQWVGYGVSTSLIATELGLGTQNLSAKAQDKTVIKIGYQKGGPLFTLYGRRDELDQKLAKLGASATWTEFPSGPPLLEAFVSGSIDFGTTGNCPPIFAQAKGVPLTYVAYTPTEKDGQALVVPKNSPLQSIQDLKGKKIAFVKASSAHNFAVQVTKAAGLKWNEIQPIYLSIADARAAFLRGDLDAWIVWDPTYAILQGEGNLRVLETGESLSKKTNYSSLTFFEATPDFASKHPELISFLIKELQVADEWAKNNPRKVAELLAPDTKIDVKYLEIAERRQPRGVFPLDDAAISGQQVVADSFFELGLIPKKITVSEAVWKPKS